MKPQSQIHQGYLLSSHQGARGPGGQGGGLLPYKSVGGARRKILKTPLKGTRILFYGRVQNSFPPLRGTNSITTNLFA